MGNNTAVIYTRYSSKNQKDISIQVQYEHCLRYAEENNLIVIKHYSDSAQSGTTDERTEFKNMIWDSKQKKFSYVIVYNLSRFSRNVLDHLHNRQILEDNNVKILSVQEGFDSDTPEGNLFNLIQMSLNQFYSSNLSRAVLNGAIASAKECNFCGGIPLLGYDIKDFKYVINEKEKETVETIFSLFLEGYSYNYISNYLNEREMLTKIGNYRKGNFKHILTNIKYTGCFTFNLYKRRKLFSKVQVKEPKPIEERVIIPNSMPKIISKEDFERVQDMLDRMKVINCYKKDKAFLDGFIECANCGKLIVGVKTKKNERSIYRCRGYSSVKCRNKPINTLYLDNYIYLFVSNFFAENNRNLYQFIKNSLISLKESIKNEINNLILYNEQEVIEIERLSQKLSDVNLETEYKIKNIIGEKTMLQLARRQKIDKLESSLHDIDTLNRNNISKVKKKFNDAFKDLNIVKMRYFLYDFMPKITKGNEKLILTINLGLFTDSGQKLLIQKEVPIEDVLEMKKYRKTLKKF